MKFDYSQTYCGTTLRVTSLGQTTPRRPERRSRKPHKKHEPSAEERAFRQALGQRIRELRSPRYSQDEFAAATDVFRSHMRTIERGKTDLKPSTLPRIAGALEMEVDELLRPGT